MTIDVVFVDSGREPRCKSDPAWPEGKPIDLRQSDQQKYCCWNLPYPAPRCGMYLVKCRKCSFSAALTVAGRPDDPRTLTVPCAAKGLDA